MLPMLLKLMVPFVLPPSEGAGPALKLHAGLVAISAQLLTCCVPSRQHKQQKTVLDFLNDTTKCF